MINQTRLRDAEYLVQIIEDHERQLREMKSIAGGSGVTTITAGTGLSGGGSGSSVTVSLDIPVTVARGGTNATTQSGARTNLGLAIGSDVQAWNTNLDTWATKTAPSGTVVGHNDTQTLTNKTISGSSNTLSNIANASLTNSSVTIGSTSISLGGTAATIAGLTLTTPTIGSFTNATHAHQSAAGGGTLDAAAIASGTIAQARLGTGSGGAGSKFLADDQTYKTPSSPAGSIVQQVDSLSTAGATGSTVIPADDTIPQNTEGNEYMTLAITPTSATNKLIIEAVWTGTNATNGALICVALFQDTTANALACSWSSSTTGGHIENIKVYHSMTAGTTSSTTFKIRAGGNAGTGTTTFNGSGGGRFGGAITHSYIRITEVAV